MSNEVYANGQEVSCKAAAGKSTAAFPDVCFTPPQTPATPPGVPIPYPNTGMASDTSGGTKTVQISGQEVMMKDSSYFKQSTGDEAGSAPKKNVITSVTKGKCYYTAWSMDVKVEGENVVRHLDMMTHNHASNPGATPPWVYIDAAAMGDADCKKQVEEKDECMKQHMKQNTTKTQREAHRKPGVTIADATTGPLDENKVDWPAIQKEEGFAPQAAVQRSFCEDDNCKDKLKCTLVPYDGFCCPAPDKKASPEVKSKTPHHVVPAHCFMEAGGRAEGEGKTYPHVKDYKHTQAPCICLDGEDKSDKEENGVDLKEHGRVHAIVDLAEQNAMNATNIMGKRDPTKVLKVERKAGTWTFGQANEEGSKAVAAVIKCDKACLKKQSEAAHQKMQKDLNDSTPLRADPSGKSTPAGFVPGGATPAVAAP